MLELFNLKSANDISKFLLQFLEDLQGEGEDFNCITDVILIERFAYSKMALSSPREGGR